MMQPILSPSLGIFFSNFYFKLAPLHIFHSKFYYLPVRWFLPKLYLTSIPSGTLLNRLKNLWEFSQTTTWWYVNLVLWLGQECRLGPICFFQNCRAWAVVQNEQNYDACLSAGSTGYIKRSRWGKPIEKSHHRGLKCQYPLGFRGFQTVPTK